MWLKEKMSMWRHQKIKQVLAIFALVATVLHVGLTSSHFIMRAAPAVAQTLVAAEANLADKAWSAEIGALICNGSGAPNNGTSNSDHPAPGSQSCPICTAVHAAVAVDVPIGIVLHAGWSRPVAIGFVSQSAVTQRGAHTFQARGPPAAA